MAQGSPQNFAGALQARRKAQGPSLAKNGAARALCVPARSERTRSCSALPRLRAPACCWLGSELAAPQGFQQRGARSSASFRLQRQAPRIGREVANSTHGAQATAGQTSTGTPSSGRLGCPPFLSLGRCF